MPSDGKMVKFSQDPDLLPAQCQMLLHKYMPEHIRSTKITQRLFVKYVIVACVYYNYQPKSLTAHIMKEVLNLCRVVVYACMSKN